MMGITRKYILILLFCSLLTGLVRPVPAQPIALQERIFVHLDRNCYLAGEKIWFTLYCMETLPRAPSSVSSMATLELFDPDGQALVRQRVKLENGMGSGCLSLPPGCVSGPYLLRSYTAWQRNEGPDAYGYNPLLIIDPNRPTIRNAESAATPESGILFYPQGGNGLSGVENRVGLPSGEDAAEAGETVRCELINLKESYVPREPVRLELKLSTPSGEPSSARLSVSVCKSGTYFTEFKHNSFLYSVLPDNPIQDELTGLLHTTGPVPKGTIPGDGLQKVRYLPEMERQIVQGTLLERSSGLPLPGRRLLLSFVDSIATLYTGVTDSSGRFFIPLDEVRGEREMVVQLYEKEPGALILPEDQFSGDPLPALHLNHLNEEKLRELFSEMLVNLQINRAYGLTHSAATSRDHPPVPAFGRFDQHIVMDDYIRLPLMEEVFRELGERVVLVREGGRYTVRLLDQQTNRIIGDDPLFFLDGVPFTDPEVLLQLDPRELKDIRFKSTRYFTRGLILDGIIEIRSIRGDGTVPGLPGFSSRSHYLGFPETERTFTTDARALENTHIPLVMNTLCFYPEYRYRSGVENSLQWIAPDHKGTYDIIIKVLDENGNIGESSWSFRVE